MLRQQELNQTKEDLAARDAEVQELKSRVAELEKLQQDQSALIAMKDSKLAAAEQRLAQSNAAAAKVDTATTTASTGEKPAQPTTPAWLWGGAGLLVLGVLAWLFTRRRTPRVEPRRMYDTEALAAGIPTAADVAPPRAAGEARRTGTGTDVLRTRAAREGVHAALDHRARDARHRAHVARRRAGRRRTRPSPNRRPPSSNSNSRAPTSTWATTTRRA